MATNGKPGKGRHGAVRNRVQYYNPKTKQWVKADRDSHTFLNVKSDGSPFKGVTKK
ncbi:hypothetical protein SIN01_17200 [Sporolactobacillus inulinus]|nr:hypothetical protein SIN01_17200 [Sporolactobacillus inulinus]